MFANAHRHKDLNIWIMSCALTKLKLNCLSIMAIDTFGGKSGSLQD